MTVLCISVRNARTTFGLFDADELVQHWRVSTEPLRTADEWGLVVGGLLHREAPGEVDRVCVSCAVPVVLRELRSMLATELPGVGTVVVGPGVRTGLPVLMDNPREVGTDRVANAVAAAALWGGPAVVVDFGTAITFEVLNARGQYVGGAIAPGVEVAVAALRERGAQLRQVEIALPRAVIAKNTVEAIQSGAVHGFAGLVDGMVNKLVAELDADVAPHVIAAGNLDSAVVDSCSTITARAPHLTLHGLRLIAERNAV